MNFPFLGKATAITDTGGNSRIYIGPFTLARKDYINAGSGSGSGNNTNGNNGNPTSQYITLLESADALGSDARFAFSATPQNPSSTDTTYTIAYETLYLLKDHLGSIRTITDSQGNALERNDYYPYGLRTDLGKNYATLGDKYRVRMPASFENFSQNGNAYPAVSSPSEKILPYRLLYNGKELQMIAQTRFIDYGARQYDPTSARWNGMDPMAEKYLPMTPYNYCAGNPIYYLDSLGMNSSPIYNTSGDFLGTDDQGLQGEAIIMEEDNFTQGMSHQEALKNNKGNEGLVSNDAINKVNKHYSNLPNRPDYDGYLTLKEVNEWYRTGSGEPLFASLEKIDLSGVLSLGEKYVGEEKSINLLLNSNSINDGLVYGNITLKRYPNHFVQAYADKYDFNMHNWVNPLNWVRNFQTKIGKLVAGDGKPFIINIYGSKKLTPILPWIK